MKTPILVLAFAILTLFLVPTAADASCGTRCVELGGCWHCDLGLFFECQPSDPDFSNGFCFQSCDAEVCVSVALDTTSESRLAAEDPASAECSAPVSSEPEPTPARILRVQVLESRS